MLKRVARRLFSSKSDSETVLPTFAKKKPPPDSQQVYVPKFDRQAARQKQAQF